jgi:hypothetical protein
MKVQTHVKAGLYVGPGVGTTPNRCETFTTRKEAKP